MNKKLMLALAVILLAGCFEKKIEFDVNSIKASDLLIKTDTKLSGILYIQAIIVNNATFDQPFPWINITFSDSDGKPTSVQNFSPAEYLGSNYQHQMMLMQRPVTISFEVEDPGADKATNYELKFTKPIENEKVASSS